MNPSKYECRVFTRKMDERKRNPRWYVGEKEINVKKSVIFRSEYRPGNGI